MPTSLLNRLTVTLMPPDEVSPQEAWPEDVAPRPKRGFIGKIGTAFGVLVGVGIVASVAMPSFMGCGVDRARDAGVQANLNTVRMGLEEYATDHGGKYPPADRLVPALAHYLPGNRLPKSAWSKAPQRTGIAVAGTDLPTAKQIAATGTAPTKGLVVGKGEVPAKGPESAYQYGAILYDLDAKSQVYVLYGIGQKNKTAQVVAVASNQ
ncbi:MAG: prokaryotic N-terminal methylation motif domain protein [Cyanobacteria bacterium RYN_339]|nr:prokaryotic N-terminal methylation motif domain protein [Cyanobacteria bacterium RYN_339]